MFPVIKILIPALLLVTLKCVHASIFVLPSHGSIVGEIQNTYSEIGETIDEAGRRFNIGYYEMVRANPHADPTNTLLANTPLIIPSQFILPDVPRKGIIINLAEYRLYYYPPDDNVVVTFPIGIGREGWNTPVGVTQITAKVPNPTWRPTSKLQLAAEELGASIPEVFPPGPNNPLGAYALRLGWPTYLIHGTNRMDGVGARVSAGCIRMLPADMEHLYSLVGVGTGVRVINEPVKIARVNNNLFMQLHPLLSEQKHNISLEKLIKTKIASSQKSGINYKLIQEELINPSGLIRKIG